jgi:putative ABC transport system permease protein
MFKSMSLVYKSPQRPKCHDQANQPGTRSNRRLRASSVAPRRCNLLLLGIFAAAALVLAVVGIYGVMGYAVTQRTHEIGVRMALGARRGELVRMVVQQGMAIAASGIAVGAAAALGLTRVMASLLYEIAPTEGPTFGVVCSVPAAAAKVERFDIRSAE